MLLREKIDEGNNVFSYIFEPEEHVDWTAGQFMRYMLPHPKMDERGQNRFFSIASAPHERVIRLTTRFASEDGSSFKKVLRNLQPDAEVIATGPSGDFVLGDPNAKYVLIAGGIGITPFRAIILDQDKQNNPMDIILLYGSRTPDPTFKAEFESISARRPNFKIHYVVDPQIIDAATIKANVPDLKDRFFYVSGPEPMVEGIDKTLAGLKIPEDKIKNDFFPNYTGI